MYEGSPLTSEGSRAVTPLEYEALPTWADVPLPLVTPMVLCLMGYVRVHVRGMSAHERPRFGKCKKMTG